MFAAAAGGSLVSSFFGRRDAKKQWNTQDAWLDKKLNEYDIPLWQMEGDKMKADWQANYDLINTQIENDTKYAEFQDQNRLDAWNLANDINEQEFSLATQRFKQSEKTFLDQINYNKQAANLAEEDTAREFEEQKQKFSYQKEDLILENVLAADQQRARGRAGKTVSKIAQARTYQFGKNSQVLMQSLLSKEQQVASDMRQIALDKKAADITARSRRMIAPIRRANLAKPMKTPIAKRNYPRPLQDFDFGVKPIKGLNSVHVPSWGSVFANAAVSGLNAYAAKKWG